MAFGGFQPALGVFGSGVLRAWGILGDSGLGFRACSTASPPDLGLGLEVHTTAVATRRRSRIKGIIADKMPRKGRAVLETTTPRTDLVRMMAAAVYTFNNDGSAE